MFYYLLPVQNVLLEYVIKLGESIFFPADANEEDMLRSSMNDYEKDILKKILEKNNQFFNSLGNCAFLLVSSEFDVKDIDSDVSIIEKIFSKANRSIPVISEIMPIE